MSRWEGRRSQVEVGSLLSRAVGEEVIDTKGKSSLYVDKYKQRSRVLILEDVRAPKKSGNFEQLSIRTFRSIF